LLSALTGETTIKVAVANTIVTMDMLATSKQHLLNLFIISKLCNLHI